MHAELAQMIHRAREVFDIGAARAAARGNEPGRLPYREPSGVTCVMRISDESKDGALAARQARAQQSWFVDRSSHFALPQRLQREIDISGLDAKSDAAARAPAFQSEDDTGLLWCTAPPARVNAECAVIAEDKRRSPTHVRNAGIPHQRSVSEDPQIAPWQLEVRIMAQC